MSDRPAAAPRDYHGTHIVVGTPCYGGNLTHHYVISALNLQLACLQRGIGVSFKLLGNDSLITRARNLIAAQFLDDPDATHLLFVDADIGFAPDQVFALLDAGKDVAGGVYPLKRLDWGRLAARSAAGGGIGGGNLKSAALDYVVDFADPKNIVPEGSFVPVRRIGTGFLMIRRGVFERMAPAYPELKLNGTALDANAELASPNLHAFFECMIEPGTGVYLSEDYAFCHRWTAIGGEIWANALSRLTHVGPVAFEGDMAAMLASLGK